MMEFKYSVEESKEIAKSMFEYLNPQNDLIGEEEVMKIMSIAYQGLRTEDDIKYDDIVSYLNFHGGKKQPGKISYKEFE